MCIRENYCRSSLADEYLFEVELVSKILFTLDRGKAAGRDCDITH
jgi:hypothetical protein